MAHDNPVIRQEGFEVVGTEYDGGWIVMPPRRDYDREAGAYYRSPFIAAFSTFDEMLAWLAKQTRHDNMPSLTQPGEKQP